LAALLQALVDHHDVLRLRILAAAGGGAAAAELGLEVLPRGAVSAAGLLRRVAVGSGWETADDVIGAATEAAERRLDPWGGVVLQAVWFDGSAAGAGGGLLLVIHHLAVDGVSWRILQSDLAAGWAAAAAGRTIELPRGGTPFRQWSERLLAQADGAAVLAELPYWRGVLADPGLR